MVRFGYFGGAQGRRGLKLPEKRDLDRRPRFVLGSVFWLARPRKFKTCVRSSIRTYEEIVSKNYSARKVEYLVRNKKGTHKEKTIDTNILKTQERIQKILGLNVHISNKKNNSGKITIEYKDLDQFELISDLLTKN